MQFSEITRGRPKLCVFGIFESGIDVLGLEGLENNYKKLRGIVKMGQSKKAKV